MAGTDTPKEQAYDFISQKDFIRAVGRRKEAVARVRLFVPGKGRVVINGVSVEDYFPYFEWQEIVLAPLKETDIAEKVDISVKVEGGGKRGQAEAVRHGIARALVAYDEGYKKPMRALGFLTRDSRVKERKKPGLKRARRAPQWSKR